MNPEANEVAITDQLGAHMRGVARVLGEFFDELLAQGFERAEAELMTRDYLAHLNGTEVDEDDE